VLLLAGDDFASFLFSAAAGQAWVIEIAVLLAFLPKYGCRALAAAQYAVIRRIEFEPFPAMRRPMVRM